MKNKHTRGAQWAAGRPATPTRAAWCLIAACGLSMLACDPAQRISDWDVKPVDLNPMIQMLASKKKRTVLVDVRQPAAFAKGHIPGAVNIPINQLRRGDKNLSEAHNIVAYAGQLDDMLAPAAAKTLLRLGYKNVYSFYGGLDLWRRSNKQVEGGEPTGSTMEPDQTAPAAIRPDRAPGRATP